MNIKETQARLRDYKMDGWLLYDFRHNNPLADRYLGLEEAHLTRRLFYWIPAEGEPTAVVSALETVELPGKVKRYRTLRELKGILKGFLKAGMRVAMEYSENPYLSTVDGGTIDLVRGFGVEVVSSGDLLTRRLTEQEMESHREAARFLEQTVERTWEFIGSVSELSEYDVVQFMLAEFQAHGYIAADGPICAVGPNSANPHYMPKEESAPVEGWILLDLWAKKPGGIYADITRVGCFGQPSAEQKEVVGVVKRASDAAIDLVKRRMASGEALMGAEVDRAARKVIVDAGYGEQFIHRLGHNIDTETHGPGTHLDSYENEDQRLLLPGTCCSIEPGIYLPGHFGVRLECDLLIRPDRQIEITGANCQEMIKILGL